MLGSEPDGIGNFLAEVKHDVRYHQGTSTRVLGFQDFSQTASGLFLPSQSVHGAVPLDAYGVFVTWNEVFDVPVNQQQLILQVQKFNRDELLIAVARVLSMIRRQDPGVAGITQALMATLEPKATNRLRVLITGNRPVLSPQGLMLLLRLTLEHGNPQGAPLAGPQDLLVALLCLMAQSVVGVLPEEELEAARRIRVEMAANVSLNRAMRERDSLVTLENVWLNRNDARARRHRELFYKHNQLELETFAQLGFALHAHALSGGGPFEDQVLQHLPGTTDEHTRALGLVSRSLEEFAIDLKGGTSSGTRFAWDFSVLVKTPLAKLTDGRYLILDPAMLPARFWALGHFYDATRCMTSSERSRHEFDVHSLFEDHITGILQETYGKGTAQRLYREHEISAAYGGHGIKVADAAVDMGDAWLAIEVTAAHPKYQALNGHSDEDYQDLIEQAAREARQALSTAAHLAHQPSALSGVDSAGGKKIWPLVVFAEPFPITPITQSDVRERTAIEHPGWPVMEVEMLNLSDLMLVSEIARHGGPALSTLLQEKAASAFSFDSLYQYITLKRQEIIPGEPPYLDWLPFADRLIGAMSDSEAPRQSP